MRSDRSRPLRPTRCDCRRAPRARCIGRRPRTGCRREGPDARARPARQAILVETLGREVADARRQATSDGRGTRLVRRHRLVLAEHVLQRRTADAIRMDCPSWAARAAADRRAAPARAAARVHASALASDIWPASSTKSTSTRSASLLAQYHAVPPTTIGASSSNSLSVLRRSC